MQVVIADTGPLNYLLLVGEVDLLPQLFEVVLIPETVRAELADNAAPDIVRGWALAPPTWLVIRPTPVATGFSPKLDAGEQAAIDLAVELRAELILIDDRAAVKAARARGFIVTGTLGILARAAAKDLVDLEVALTRLSQTNFRTQPGLIDALLAEYSAGRKAR